MVPENLSLPILRLIQLAHIGLLARQRKDLSLAERMMAADGDGLTFGIHRMPNGMGSREAVAGLRLLPDHLSRRCAGQSVLGNCRFAEILEVPTAKGGRR